MLVCAFVASSLLGFGPGCGGDSASEETGTSTEMGAVSFPTWEPTPTSSVTMCVETHPLTSSGSSPDTGNGADDGGTSTSTGYDPGMDSRESLSDSDSTSWPPGPNSSGPDSAVTTDPDSGGAVLVSSSGLDGSSTSPGIDEEVCGDGDADPGEECDDATPDDPNAVDGCDATCKRTARFAFVSSKLWVGGVLTLESADAACSAVGNVALGEPYPSTKWKAWISAVDENALDRIGPGDLPLIMPGGYKLVDSNAALGTGVLSGAFNHDELGNKVGANVPTCADASARVWTFTDSDGNVAITCEDAASATVGSTNDAGVGWTALCDADCGGFGHIYCIEVP